MNDTAAPVRNDVIRVGQIEIRYLQESGNGCEIGSFEMTIPPNAMVPPPHSHTDNEEFIYVLSGTLLYTVDGETRDLGPGESMATPRGSVHAFSNPHSETTRALVVNAPDIGAGYFREIAAILDTGGPPDRSRLLATMEKYGLKLAPPVN